jgi:hypothetical protein
MDLGWIGNDEIANFGYQPSVLGLQGVTLAADAPVANSTAGQGNEEENFKHALKHAGTALLHSESIRNPKQHNVPEGRNLALP